MSLATNIYYTYMLVDPRNNLPFYIGKGQRNRCNSHITEARNTNKNSPKLQKIRKIESLGLQVIIKKVLTDVSDSEAKEFEMLVIAECLDKGIILTNQTAGGEGSTGFKHTEESKALISEKLLDMKKPESQKIKLSVYLKEHPIIGREGVREKVSGENHWAYGKEPYNKGIPMSLEQRQILSEVTSGENHWAYGTTYSAEHRANISAGTKGVKKSTTINMRKPRSKIECPHCGQIGGSNNMHRWHFDNCKLKADLL